MKRTTRAKLKGELRRIWMRSNERSTALKRDKYTCQDCGAKKSVKKGAEVKIHVHHKEGIDNWDDIIDMIMEKLLCHPDKLEVLCVDCHDNKA